MLSVVFWLVNYVANGNVKMGKIRDITLYKFACRRFLWLPIGQYLSLVLPLQTEGESRLFHTLLAVFCTGCAQGGGADPWPRCGEGQAHGRGEKQAARSMEDEGGTAGCSLSWRVV